MRKIFRLYIIITLVLITLTSCSSRTVYKVTYRDYDDTVLKQEDVLINKPSTPPTSPVREGYIFIGWSKDVSCITENTTVYAKYVKRLSGMEETIELFDSLGYYSYAIDNNFLDEAGITDYTGIMAAEKKDYSDFFIGICFKNSVSANINSEKAIEFLKMVVSKDKPEYVNQVVYVKEQQWVYVGTENMIEIFKK